MNANTTPFLTELAAFFAMMNPLANTPIFLSLTQSENDRNRRLAAVQSVALAFVIVATFGAIGSVLLKVFGITLEAFRIAGGFVIAKVGYDLLYRGTSQTHAPSAQAQAEATASDFSVVVSPLAIPLLAGPGTIVTTITYTAHGTMIEYIIALCAFAVVCIITMLCFLGGEAVVKRVSPSFLNVTGRLMGLILAVVGVQMLIDGIRIAFGIGS